jgi:hypothetical protein
MMQQAWKFCRLKKKRFTDRNLFLKLSGIPDKDFYLKFLLKLLSGRAQWLACLIFLRRTFCMHQVVFLNIIQLRYKSTIFTKIKASDCVYSNRKIRFNCIYAGTIHIQRA